MKQVTLSNERWYVTADKTRAVREGDPEAAFLLVGKDGAIAPEVAAHYGIATHTGEAIERVAQDPGQEKERMVSPGTSRETAENYEKMRIRRDVNEQVSASLTTEGNRSATRQGAMMADAMIAERQTEGSLVADAPKKDEPQSRTKEIPDPNKAGDHKTEGKDIPPPLPPGQSPPYVPPIPPLTPPDAPTGQGASDTLKDIRELEDAKDKTL